MTPSLKILFLAAEAVPFIKVGGLGDVAGSLPQALRALSVDQNGDECNLDVRLVLPFHGAIQRRDYVLRPVAKFTVPHASGPIYAEVLETEVNGLRVYLISGPPIPKDAPVYSTDASVDGFKFTFFSLAALELPRQLHWIPDVIHANDWHTAPAIYALNVNGDPIFDDTVTVLGLHNLPFLGVGAGPAMGGFGLPPASEFTRTNSVHTRSALPQWADHMPLPLALLTADHIVAASPTYAKEIFTPEFGSGLEDFLRSRADSISGILNGINTHYWDPEIDSHLAANYTIDTIPARAANKEALVREFGLNPDPHIPLLAMVSRMDPQKGVDLVPEALRQIASVPEPDDQPWQAIILGTGVPTLEAAVRRLEVDFPDRVRTAIRFDSPLSHRIYAGADALLIPSRYEPCGLTQMIAMRYGCIPIARATGGLRDTIQDHARPERSTGFLFRDATSEKLASAMLRALAVYAEPEKWRSLQRNGMAQDFSWERFARQYFDLYRDLIEKT